MLLDSDVNAFYKIVYDIEDSGAFSRNVILKL